MAPGRGETSAHLLGAPVVPGEEGVLGAWGEVIGDGHNSKDGVLSGDQWPVTHTRHLSPSPVCKTGQSRPHLLSACCLGKWPSLGSRASLRWGREGNSPLGMIWE